MVNQIIGRLRRMSPMKIIFLGYCVIVLMGTLLLSLPAATRTGQPSSFSDAFFTATSATCVTGLVRFDTYLHWSPFGQGVILSLIQIGGMGFMTYAIALIALMRRKIGLGTRVVMQNSIAAPHVGGIVRMTRFILLGSLLVEGIGALLLGFYFCPRIGLWQGIWFAVFHSVSAFCNAGFDLMGDVTGPYSSLTGFVGNWYVTGIIMALIVIGGLGFFVWKDLLDTRFRFSRMRLHTKMVLSVTLLLILIGALGIFLMEQESEAFAGKTLSEQAAGALFQSVTARTAGFNTLNLSAMTQSSQFLLICLMMIGGSPGSTAGGIKTTTFGVMVMTIFSIFRKRKNMEAFGRRMEDWVARSASCVFMMYLTLSLVAAMVISRVEGLPLLSALFECASAIGTVGLSFGITPTLGMLSKALLAGLMLFGRVGSITILLAFASEKNQAASKLPLEKIQIG